MTKRQSGQAIPTVKRELDERFTGPTLDGVFSDYVQFLKAELAASRKEVDYYRGKCERLEYAIMSEGSTPAQNKFAATVPTVHHTAESIARNPEAPAVVYGGTKHARFEALRKDWNSKSAEEQADLMGEPRKDPQPTQV